MAEVLKADPFRTGDEVWAPAYSPYGETWVVAYCEGGMVHPCGYPNGQIRAELCRLRRAATDAESEALLMELAASTGHDDRHEWARRVLRERGDRALLATLDGLGFAELRRVNVARCGTAFHRVEAWSLPEWACAMGGEAGEALNVVKKHRRGDLTDGELREQLGAELADVVTYADLLAHRAGIDLGAAVRRKFNQVSQRRACDVTLPAEGSVARG